MTKSRSKQELVGYVILTIAFLLLCLVAYSEFQYYSSEKLVLRKDQWVCSGHHIEPSHAYLSSHRFLGRVCDEWRRI